MLKLSFQAVIERLNLYFRFFGLFLDTYSLSLPLLLLEPLGCFWLPSLGAFHILKVLLKAVFVILAVYCA